MGDDKGRSLTIDLRTGTLDALASDAIAALLGLSTPSEAEEDEGEDDDDDDKDGDDDDDDGGEDGEDDDDDDGDADEGDDDGGATIQARRQTGIPSSWRSSIRTADRRNRDAVRGVLRA